MYNLFETLEKYLSEICGFSLFGEISLVIHACTCVVGDLFSLFLTPFLCVQKTQGPPFTLLYLVEWDLLVAPDTGTRPRGRGGMEAVHGLRLESVVLSTLLPNWSLLCPGTMSPFAKFRQFGEFPAKPSGA